MSASRVVSLVLVAACGPTTEAVDLSDQGQACVVPEGDGYYDWYGTTDTFALDEGPSEIVVVLARCYSSSFLDVHASCEAVTSGTTIAVTSEGGWLETREPQNSDCNRLETRCPGPDLTTGEWTLEYGGERLTFDVPTDRAPCLEL